MIDDFGFLLLLVLRLLGIGVGDVLLEIRIFVFVLLLLRNGKHRILLSDFNQGKGISDNMNKVRKFALKNRFHCN